MKRSLQTISSVILLLFGSLLVHAEDRALLIGVGKYANQAANLPGIDIDIDVMKGVVKQLGYKDKQVKVLMDNQATLPNIDKAFKGWLGSGVKKDDKVLIYYSGHGTNIPDENGDEDDKVDEVLLLHDFRQVTRNGVETFDNVLIDDHFNELLKKIPSKNVLVMVDACHSGTITKRIRLNTRNFYGEEEAVAKFYAYEGMPLKQKGSFTAREGKKGKWVAISAAQDDELSIATKSGSVFTLGVRESVREAANGRAALTPRKLTQDVTDYVEDKLPSSRVFHPQINGNAELMGKRIHLASLSESSGVVWGKLEKLVEHRDKVVSVTLNQSSYAYGDALEVNIKLPESGYLNVINVGPKDEATILFPNEFHQDNYIKSSSLQIPTNQMDFDLITGNPTGKNMIVAILTKKRLNAYELASGGRNPKGDLIDSFGLLSPVGMKAMRGSFSATSSSGKKNWLGAGMVTTKVCKSKCN